MKSFGNTPLPKCEPFPPRGESTKRGGTHPGALIGKKDTKKRQGFFKRAPGFSPGDPNKHKWGHPVFLNPFPLFRERELWKILKEKDSGYPLKKVTLNPRKGENNYPG